MPRTRSSRLLNHSNLLAGLTPVFANWTQNPGTAADIVDELTNAVLTTNGISILATSTITYDLGTSARRIFEGYCSKSDFVLNVSDDGLVFYPATGAGFVQIATGKFRYAQLKSGTTQTYTVIKMRAYNI